MAKVLRIKTTEKKAATSPVIDEDSFNKTLGSRLKAIRKAKGISQDFLGNYLKVHQTTICRIENGDQTVTPQQLDLLSRLYKIKIDDMINEKIPILSFTKKK